MPVFDVWDSATNTELVRRSIQAGLESSPRVGDRIAPLVNTSANRIKKAVVERKALGVAQIVARYAAPAIYTPEIRYSEEWIELAKMDEMSPIEEDEWDKLENGTDYEKNTVGADLLSRARDMQIRYETRTEVMRWAAFKDELAFQLAEGGTTPPTIEVKFDMPTENKPSGSDWTNRTTSTPVTDLEGFQEIPFEAASVWALDLYMSNATYKNLKYSKQISDLLSDDANTFKIPTKTQVESLLTGGSFNAENEGNPQGTNIIITDAGYRPESAGFDRGSGSVTKFLPDHYVLAAVRGQVDGENVAEVLNGRVAIRPNEAAKPQWVQGPANHTWAKQSPPYTHYTRQVCKRIPRVNRPECLVWAFVGDPTP